MTTAQSDYFVHESAIVDTPSEIGVGTKIWHFSHVLKHTRIGRGCTIGQNVVIGPNVTIGNRCKVQNNVSIYEGVELEDGVFCGPSMVFTNVTNPRAFVERKAEFRRTLVREGATIGANATIVCGVTLGRFCMVGAGAVVTRDVPDYALVHGNPARVRGAVCRCGVVLRVGGQGVVNPSAAKIQCPECAAEYSLQSGYMQPLDSRHRE
jgi:UDP-2-acetamido-3-amino-2,3-dideoxy-glucuronate N-acetyltransferase